ncbi:hypothetical protein PG993_004533 [Apiospora rasikravindrae]|uniref:Uncharacterized protein n=1 Tax=Apiospora rasikravindrae TaxID=990691 RepID=A0ABR1TFH4_9PEZI
MIDDEKIKVFVKALPIFSHMTVDWDTLAQHIGMLNDTYAKTMFVGLAQRDGVKPTGLGKRKVKLSLSQNEMDMVVSILHIMDEYIVDWEVVVTACGMRNVEAAKTFFPELAYREMDEHEEEEEEEEEMGEEMDEVDEVDEV